jgi:hypothetical protein
MTIPMRRPRSQYAGLPARTDCPPNDEKMNWVFQILGDDDLISENHEDDWEPVDEEIRDFIRRLSRYNPP